MFEIISLVLVNSDCLLQPTEMRENWFLANKNPPSKRIGCAILLSKRLSKEKVRFVQAFFQFFNFLIFFFFWSFFFKLFWSRKSLVWSRSFQSSIYWDVSRNFFSLKLCCLLYIHYPTKWCMTQTINQELFVFIWLTSIFLVKHLSKWYPKKERKPRWKILKILIFRVFYLPLLNFCHTNKVERQILMLKC